MTHIYRETDPVSGRWTGNSSGADLTAFQIDQNFYEVLQAIATLTGSIGSTVGIASITISGNEITFHMTDSTLQGPFALPSFTFVDRGAWAPTTSYSVNDTFTINGTLYLVIFAHTSASSFSAGANDGLGHNYYSPMLSLPGNSLPTGGATAQVLQKSSATDFAVTWGYKLPTGGSTHQVLLKQSSTNQDAAWATLSAPMVSFSPSTASGLTSTNVSDAIEEVEANSHAAIATLTDVTFSTGDPLTGALLYFGGSKWVPTAAPSSGDLASWDGAAWVGVAQSTLSLSVTQLRDGIVTSLGTSGTVSLDPSLGDVFTITPTGAVTLNAASAPPSAEITLVVTTSGTSSFNITPSTNFISAGALATGTVSGKTFTVKFVGTGTSLVEVSRTAAM